MSKRILYLEDLYDFYSHASESVHYSAEMSNGTPLVVQARGRAQFEQSNDAEGLTLIKIRAAHTGLNLNQSSIDIDVMNRALPSLKNRPILGYIHEVGGQPQFEGHEMHVDLNGNVVYDEHPIGIIPETNNAKIVYDEEAGKSYVEADGYIFDEYSAAKEIFQREGECPCSVELSIRDLSYNAKDKVLVINDFFFSGITVLGYRDDGEPVRPGMEGANMKLADFVPSVTSVDFSEQVIEMQGKLDALLSHFDIGQSSAQVSFEEGGNGMSNFENETATVEEQIVEEVQSEGTETVEETVVEDGTSTEDAPVEDPAEDQGTEAEDTEEVVEEPEVVENMTRVYEISHDDIRMALYGLLSPREEANGDCYIINQVYDDRFIYESWFNGSLYGQKYTKEDDVVAFDGDPYTVHAEYLTDSELDVLNSMRSNYEALVEFKNTTEQNVLHAERIGVMSDTKYSIIAETEAYKSLYAEMDNYSCDELHEKLKVIVGEYALNGGKFEAIETPKKEFVPMFFRDINKSQKKNKYGTLKFD